MSKNNNYLGNKRDHDQAGDRGKDEVIYLYDTKKQRQHESQSHPIKIQEKALPIEAKKEEILSTIENNQIMIISGSTGCGKTTKVPIYLYEQYGRNKNFKLLVTQPRRIATKSIANRLSDMLGTRCGKLVGYKIGMTDETSSDTRIIIATTGLFYNIIIHQEDLAEYSHIILDEVHEREIDIDIVLIMIKHILPRNKNLKLILMSATIQIELFARYFSKSLMQSFIKFDHYSSEKNKGMDPVLPDYLSKDYECHDVAPTIQIQGSPFTNEIFYMEKILNGLKEEHLSNKTAFKTYFSPNQFYFDKTSPKIEENMFILCSYLIQTIHLGKINTNEREDLTTILVFLPGVYEIETQEGYLEKLDIIKQLEIVKLHSNQNE
jgi:HrpA-like RNA helicase